MGKIEHIKGVKKLRANEVVPFTRQIASMFGAGMSVLTALETLRDQCTNVEFKKVLVHLCETLESGEPLSKGVADFPRLFDEMYVNMMIAGEQSGRFNDVMRRLAALLQNAARLRRKVKGALTYPTVIISIALLLAGGLIQFVVPIFAEMFSGFGKELPALTQMLVDVSDFVKRWWYAVGGGVAVAVFAFNKWRATSDGQLKLDELKLRLPVFGQLLQKVAIARFCRLMGQMDSAGVPILKAMDVVAGSIGNKIYEKSIRAARAEVEQGNQVSPSLAGKPYMPVLMVRMLAAGERTGKEGEMFESVADTYEEDVEAMLATLTSLMEPFLMVFLGAIIGTIVLAMFLPIFNLGSLAS